MNPRYAIHVSQSIANVLTSTGCNVGAKTSLTTSVAAGSTIGLQPTRQPAGVLS